MKDRFEHVTALTQASVYFDGKCVSHTILLQDGSKKTLGVILPSTLTFSTAAPEQMDITSGTCKVKLADSDDWITYAAGTSFKVAANTSFQIEALDNVNYVCHYG